jgi:putative component of membrane protein insertase Oxa1/YidC/SpoIIIJ protein YidD
MIAIDSHYLLYIALTQLFRIVSQRKKYVIVGVKFFVQCSSRSRRRRRLVQAVEGLWLHMRRVRCNQLKPTLMYRISKFSPASRGGIDPSPKEVQIVYRLFLVYCYLLHVPRLPTQPASYAGGWVIGFIWLELGWQYIAMTRINLSIIWISLPSPSKFWKVFVAWAYLLYCYRRASTINILVIFDINVLSCCRNRGGT